MASEDQNLLDIIFSTVGDSLIGILCQTLLYGIYLYLVLIAVHVMVANGLQSRSRKWLLAIITSMFALLTVYWTFSLVFTFIRVDQESSSIRTCFGGGNATLCLFHEVKFGGPSAASWLGMFDDILLVNYLIADGAVVWRAWILCFDQSKIVLMIPVVMFALNTAVYLMTIALRVAIAISLAGPHRILFNTMIGGTQLTHLVLSLLINISVTSLIALKAWKYRKMLMECGIGVRTPTGAIRILAILVESGVIYILIGVLVLVPLVISVVSKKDSGLGDMFIPVGLQLVGIYPIVVVLLVEKNRSLNSTFRSFGAIIDVREGQLSQTEPTSSMPGPVLAPCE